MKEGQSLCVAQTCPARGDVAANLAEHVRLVELAAAYGAQVVLFPELSLTGYELELADELAMSMDDPRLAPLVALASSHSLTIIAGAPVRIEQQLHNGAFVVDPTRAVSLYTKRHLGAFAESDRCDGRLPPPEASVFEPGTLDPLVQFEDDLVAVAICSDTGRAAHPRRAADRGAKGYLASMFVTPSYFESDSARLSRYASEHSMFVALANFGSPTGGLPAAGRSSIWSEQGELLVRLPASGSGIAIATWSTAGWRARTELRGPARS